MKRILLVVTTLMLISISASTHQANSSRGQSRFGSSKALNSAANNPSQQAREQFKVENAGDPSEGIYRNPYGAVVRDSAGNRINYSREELETQESQARANGPAAGSAESGSAPSNIGDPTWGYAVFGSGIGLSNITVAQNGGLPEIYMGGSSATFGGNAYWYALRYNATSHNYDQLYASPYFPAGIMSIRVADVVGDSAQEIIVALGDGHINLYDQVSKSLLNTITTAANGLTGLCVGDRMATAQTNS